MRPAVPGFRPFLKGVRHILLALAILQLAALGGVAAGERKTDGIGRLAQAAENAAPQVPGETLDVRVEGERISLTARGADIRDILAAVRDRTGVAIAMDGDIRGRIDLTLSRVSLDELLRRLCRNRAIEYAYDPERKAYRIVRAVLPASGPAGVAAPGPAAGNSPPPPPASADSLAARGAGDPASERAPSVAARPSCRPAVRTRRRATAGGASCTSPVKSSSSSGRRPRRGRSAPCMQNWAARS